MIVCSCHGVSCRTIRSEARDGAQTVKEVGLRCGAGRGCGMCRRQIAGLLREERQNAAEAEGGVDTGCPVVTLGGNSAAA